MHSNDTRELLVEAANRAANYIEKLRARDIRPLRGRAMVQPACQCRRGDPFGATRTLRADCSRVTALRIDFVGIGRLVLAAC